MAIGSVGPASDISLQLAVAVIWMSSKVRPPAQGGQVTSAMAVVTFMPNGWAACTKVGITAVGVLGLLG